MNSIANPLFTVNHAATALPAGAARGSEVVALDAARGLLFVIGADGVDALRLTDGSLAFAIPKSAIPAPGGGAPPAYGTGNSVAVHGDMLAVALDGPAAGANGYVALYTIDPGGTGAAWAATFEVGAVPDMVVFAPDGGRLLVAIEGEPVPDTSGSTPYTASFPADPPGGVTVIELADPDPLNWTSSFFGFGAFDAQAAALRAAGVKINTAIPVSAAYNTALPSLDFEPEYIAISPDGARAFVTLQENNAIGVFNLDAMAGPLGWVTVLPLGLANHSLAGRGIDSSDRDGGPNIRQAPVFGMYQPDAIAAFEMNGRTYLVTANEGDAREYGLLPSGESAGNAHPLNEAVRLSALVPATGGTPPAGMPQIEASLLAQIQSRRADADLGRLNVSRWSGDTDGNGQLDQIHVFGGRSFSIWEVGGAPSAPTLTQVFDSGDFIDRTVAALLPQGYFDNRSDDKGAEPEHVTLATIGGEIHVFVGLERANANMVFRIEGPTDVAFLGFINRPGDTAPETSVFVPPATPGVGGTGDARLAIANEVSRTTTFYDVNASGGASGGYVLQILHGSDFEAGLLAGNRMKQFAAIVDRLEDALPNSITLSSGDNFIPGPFAAAGTDATVVPVLRAFYEQALGLPPGTLGALNGSSSPFFAADIAILNAIGVQASVLGNHEFDLGANALAAAIDFASNTTGTTPGLRVTNIGAQFPYLSANLSFSGDAALSPLFTSMLRDAASYATTAADLADNNAVAAENLDRQISPWTVIHENGEPIGVLGVTTQILGQISTVDGVRVLDPANDGGLNNMAELAQILQPYVDQMTALGINKVILLSHLQQYQFELELATLLRGVDIIIAGGSHAVFADGNDALLPGDSIASPYPTLRTGLDGNPVVVVNTASEYAYVGRLVVEFDALGVIDTSALDPALNGPIATTDANVAALWGADNPYAAGARGGQVQAISDAVQAVINAKDGNVFGFTEVFLDGRRSEVRTEETNLGNLTADANLFVARQLDPTVQLSLKNGGGIRAEIGRIAGQPTPQELPPPANPSVNKPEGAVSQLDIENSLRFNNSLTKLSVTAANLERIFEHAVAGSTPTNTPGQFPQIGGAAFSYDLTRPAQVLVTVGSGPGATLSDTAPGGVVGERVRNLVLYNDDGTVADVIVKDGVLQGDPNRVISLVTLNFLANPGSNPLLGGDSYPFPAFTIPGSRVDLLNNPALPDGVASFAAKGSEQDALAEYLAARHDTQAKAFSVLDVGRAEDTRIQNLAFRQDTVGDPYVQVTVGERVTLIQAQRATSGPFDFAFAGGAGDERLVFREGRDDVDAGAGNDLVFLGAGNDRAQGGAGDDTLVGEGGSDILLGGLGGDLLYGGIGADWLDGGAGADTIAYFESAQGVVVRLDIGVGAGGEADQDRMLAVENVIGSRHADYLIGDAQANTLFGLEGDDWLYGQGGNDILAGGAGNDQIIGGAGADDLYGGAGNDVFWFQAADLQAGVFDRIFDFGEAAGNFDFLRFEGVASGITLTAVSGGTLVSTQALGGAGGILVVGVTPGQLADQIIIG
jgi:2',3'-cyclic-nucleotide 2'-phosphodiesterase (5'-nucleotidase family)